MEEEQQGVNAIMCRRLSERTESPTTQRWLPRDARQQEVWSSVSQLVGDPMLHGALLAFTEKSKKRVGNTHKTCCRNWYNATKVTKQARSSSSRVRMWMQRVS